MMSLGNKGNIWKEGESLLPEKYRINETNQPVELVLDWNKNKIHLDHYPNPKARAKIILLHGVGGNLPIRVRLPDGLVDIWY